MESIIIDGTKISPRINLNFEEGLIELEGRSLPEQAHDLYKPLLKWLEEYKINPKELTTVIFNLEYINSSSNKYILQILKKIDELHKAGNKMDVTWFYDEEDDDLFETATEYNDVLSVDIKIKVIKD